MVSRAILYSSAALWIVRQCCCILARWVKDLSQSGHKCAFNLVCTTSCRASCMPSMQSNNYKMGLCGQCKKYTCLVRLAMKHCQPLQEQTLLGVTKAMGQSGQTKRYVAGSTFARKRGFLVLPLAPACCFASLAGVNERDCCELQL